MGPGISLLSDSVPRVKRSPHREKEAWTPSGIRAVARHAPSCLFRWRCVAPRAGDPEPVLPALYQGAVAADVQRRPVIAEIDGFGKRTGLSSNG
jgi:hypothetical protein